MGQDDVTTHEDAWEGPDNEEYNQGDQSRDDDQDIWHDTSLINYWDAALRGYMSFHKKDAEPAILIPAPNRKQPQKNIIESSKRKRSIEDEGYPEEGEKDRKMEDNRHDQIDEPIVTGGADFGGAEDGAEEEEVVEEDVAAATEEEEEEEEGEEGEADAPEEQGQESSYGYQNFYSEPYYQSYYYPQSYYHASSDAAQAHPPPPPPPMPFPGQPPAVAGYTNDDGFANMIMAWYYSGYYTGYYQARQR
ncbi:hypothetical protein BX666DRAFT_1950333 [Dichotomocladium elegans]|nr:hypothetical protein BX666DRAFT_1950333 [Dichotomocladium elegans]